MTRLYRRQPRGTRRLSLGRAVGHTAVYAFLIVFGFLQLDSALHHTSSYFLFSGPLILTVGVAGLFNGVALVQRGRIR
jgi:hypothetical protein